MGSSIICKPCLAFDALGSFIFSDYCRGDISRIKEWIGKKYESIHISPSNVFFDILISHHTLNEIEAFDIDTLVDIYPSYIQGDEYVKNFEAEINKGLDILKHSDFMEVWENDLLPILNNQCNDFITSCDENVIKGVLRDVCCVKQESTIDNIHICMTYFMWPVSFYLTANSYLTNNTIKGKFNTNQTVQLLAHELSHRFSNEESRNAYRNAHTKDAYFHKTNWFLSNIIGAPGDEEEFVQAIEHAIAIRNGLETYEHAMGTLFTWYRCCVPIAIILFSELTKLNELPTDMNKWICMRFSDGTIECGHIEQTINALMPDYVDKFNHTWEDEVKKNPDRFVDYR